MSLYKIIETPQELFELVNYFYSKEIHCLAMDFEEESNLHIYGEHLCLIQLYDRTNYYIIDAWKIQKYSDGIEALRFLLESPIEKIMFGCASDAAIVRKSLKIKLCNVYDTRIIAMSLGLMGNLTSIIEHCLHIQTDNLGFKKKYQQANWTVRPISEEQLQYAMDDVRYLFDIKSVLQNEFKTLSMQEQKKTLFAMHHCAEQKHKNKPGWTKIGNWSTMEYEEKIYLKNFFIARDNIARKENVPPNRILEKSLLLQMAYEKSYQNILLNTKYQKIFEDAQKKSAHQIAQCAVQT